MAKKQKGVERVVTPTVVDPEREALATIPELGLAIVDGNAIKEFLGGVVQTFIRGRELEARSVAVLTLAQALKPPTTADEDLEVQHIAEDARAAKKAVTEHWTITALASQIHKRFVAVRSRGEKPAEDALEIANQHHNKFVRDQQRAAALEQERVRQEAERQAREDRQRELDELERKALMAEIESNNLSSRELHFVNLVANGFNTPEASARAAGYKNAEVVSGQLMAKAKIIAAIKSAKEAAALRKQAEAVKEQPLEVEVKTVKADIQGKLGTTRWSAEVTDEDAFLEAWRSGKYGIPRDCVQPCLPKLNELARGLHEQMDRIPGLRAKKDTSL